MIIQKGGNVVCLSSGVWEGLNRSGEADALLFNELGLNCNEFWKLWRYPLMDEGIMSSEVWNDNNKERILELLNNIIDVRSNEIQRATDTGRREHYRNSLSRRDGHSRILSYVIQLRNLVRDNDTVNFLDQVRWEEPDDPNAEFDITETEGYSGVLSEVGNLNPSEHGEKIDPVKERARKSGGGKRKKNKTIKKKLHYIPTKNKTVWSSGMFGERQVINLPKYLASIRADNLNKIKGKNKHLLRDEYKRRLKVLLKKSKKSRRHFKRKTKKKYNIKSIDKTISNISDERLTNLYKNLLKKS